MRTKTFVIASILFLVLLATAPFFVLSNVQAVPAPTSPTLDPTTIPQFVNQLVIPPVYVPTYAYDTQSHQIVQTYHVDMNAFSEQILPTQDAHGNPTGLPQTPVWGYGGIAKDAVTGQPIGYIENSPGPTFEAIRGIPIKVTYQNNINTPYMFAVDPTIHWADPTNPMPSMMRTFPEPYPVFDGATTTFTATMGAETYQVTPQTTAPLVTHLHGGEVQSTSDGGPNGWYTAGGLHGTEYQTYEATAPNAAVDFYPNAQQPATLWYHDHAMGLTRINVMSGLAGFYMLRDPTDPIEKMLPTGKYDIPIAIQDRSFNTDGSMWFPSDSPTPDVHPYWNPEFFGNTIMVNGKVWPNLNVDQGQYRFRLLDGSNARFYNLTFRVVETGAVVPFTLIGTEGGFIKSPVTLTSILIAPAERPDVLVDFSKVPTGDHVILTNDAAAPYPMGDPGNFDANTVGHIMQFTVGAAKGAKAANLPTVINPTLVNTLKNSAGNTRVIPLLEVADANDNPVQVTINGQNFDGTGIDTPQVGTTEDWYITNLTPDTHPMHLHLVQFQLVSRILFDAAKYKADWLALNGNQQIPFPNDYQVKTLDPRAYINGPAVKPTASELAWKDTIQSPPGYLTIIRVRFAPQDVPGMVTIKPGTNLYPFDPTVGPGYVYHCHIIDHEDNDMMRPYKVVP